MSKTHEVKCWPEFYAAIVNGTKTFDLRKNDRGYAVGDYVLLLEWDPDRGTFTGRETKRRIAYMLLGVGVGGIAPLKGLASGYCILGLAYVHAGQRHQFWTKEREKMVTTMNADGFSAAEIANALSQRYGVAVSRNSVIGKLYRTHV